MLAECAQVVLEITVAQRGAMSERPNHVVLTVFLADSRRNLVDVDEEDVMVFADFRGEKHVEPLDKVHDVSKIEARLKAPERILLRNEESENKSKQFKSTFNLSTLDR